MTMVTCLPATALHARDVVTIAANESVQTAARKMQKDKVGCLVVLDERGKATVGIVTERDITRGVVAESADPVSTLVQAIMTADVISCSVDTTTSQAHELMATHGIRHLPIIENGVPVGIVSTRDILAHRLEVLNSMKAGAESIARLIRRLRSLDLNELLRLTTAEACRIFSVRRSVLHISGNPGPPAQQPLICRRNCPCPEEALLVRDDPAQSSAAPKLVHADVPAPCTALGAVPPRLHVALGLHATHPHSVDGGESICGYLCMCHGAPDLSETDEALHYTCALLRDILSTNLTNALVIHREARTDALTTVGTRHVFEERFRAEYARAAIHQWPFSVALVDVDGLKRINDQWGHTVGDRVLRVVAETLRTHARVSDVVARFGGDEFALLMPETSASDAVKALERMRRQIASASWPEGPAFTVSCGAAEWSGDPEDSETAILERADAALYNAKRNGCDRVDCLSSANVAESGRRSPMASGHP